MIEALDVGNTEQPRCSASRVLWRCVGACLHAVQAAAAAAVTGVGLGVMPLTSLALGIDPGFLSMTGESRGALQEDKLVLGFGGPVSRGPSTLIGASYACTQSSCLN